MEEPCSINKMVENKSSDDTESQLIIVDALGEQRKGPIYLPGNEVFPWQLVETYYSEASRFRTPIYRGIIRRLDSAQHDSKTLSVPELEEALGVISRTAIHRDILLDKVAHSHSGEAGIISSPNSPDYINSVRQLANFHDFYSRRAESSFRKQLEVLNELSHSSVEDYSLRSNAQSIMTAFEAHRQHNLERLGINHPANPYLTPVTSH